MKLLFHFKELNCVYIIGECNQCLFKVLLYLNWAQFETFYFVMKFKVGRGRKWKIGQGLRLLWSISKFHLSLPKSLQVLEPLKILTWFQILEVVIEVRAADFIWMRHWLAELGSTDFEWNLNEILDISRSFSFRGFRGRGRSRTSSSLPLDT